MFSIAMLNCDWLKPMTIFNLKTRLPKCEKAELSCKNVNCVFLVLIKWRQKFPKSKAYLMRVDSIDKDLKILKQVAQFLQTYKFFNLSQKISQVASTIPTRTRWSSSSLGEPWLWVFSQIIGLRSGLKLLESWEFLGLANLENANAFGSNTVICLFCKQQIYETNAN